MDVYTVSFNLPHHAATQDPLDTSLNSPSDAHPSPTRRQSATSRIIKTAGKHYSAPVAPRKSSLLSRHIATSSGLSASSSLESFVIPDISPTGSNATAVPTLGSLVARRSTSSLGSIPQTATGPSSSAGDAASTAPSSNYPLSTQALEAAQRTSHLVAEQIRQLCVEAMSTYHCMVAYHPLDAGRGYSFQVSGDYQHVMGARGHIIRGSPYKRKSVVKVPRSEVLDMNENVRPEMRQKLDDIAFLTKAHLAIVGQVNGTLGFGLETERSVEIVLTGGFESVEQARVRLLVLLDELSGLHSDVCEVDYKLHNMICGRKRCVLQTIQEETATNIYFPTPLSGIIGTRDDMLLKKQNLIFVTGEFLSVQRAKETLMQVSFHKSKCIISRDANMLPRKLDWLLTDRIEELKQIMYDNGTFVTLPVLGSQSSVISVLGDQKTSIERSLRMIMILVCQFYVSQIWLLPMTFDGFTPATSLNPSTMPGVLRSLSSSSNCEAVFKGNCFEFHGTESEVRSAVQMALGLDVVKPFHHEVRFQIELANEHREFISGKKNGKINKIMTSAGVKIKFETFNAYNFLIDLAGNGAAALDGLALMQEELPAEVSFYVPELYHKRIIGVAGKNIQRIMKKYAVYVKFSNAEEFARLGGYADNEDNVIARTPTKNVASLEELKAEIMETVLPKDKDYVREIVSVPRRYHRVLTEKSILIHDIERKTNSMVHFPTRESASDMVTIFGPESQVHIAASMLLAHVPFEAEYRIPHSERMSRIASSPEFADMQERMKRDHNILVTPSIDRTGACQETIIRFTLNRSSQHFLPSARDAVEDLLLSHDIPLYPGSRRPRSDSFTSSLPYFNSKVLASAIDNDSSQQEVLQTRSLRSGSSSSDIKAIFEAPQLASQGQPLMPSSSSPTLHSSLPMAWRASTTAIPHTPSNFNRAPRMSEESVLPNYKRDSEPVISVDNQIMELIRQGALSHHLNARAQSLDMSRLATSFEKGAPPSPNTVSAISAHLAKLSV